MEPRQEGQQKHEVRSEPKPKRFRIVKLEERIAPGKATGGGASGGKGGGQTQCHCGGGDTGGYSIE
jgi:hypothetical protein